MKITIVMYQKMALQIGLLITCAVLIILVNVALGIAFSFASIYNSEGNRCIQNTSKIMKYSTNFCPDNLVVSSSNSLASFNGSALKSTFENNTDAKKSIGSNVKIPVIPKDNEIHAYYDFINLVDNCSISNIVGKSVAPDLSANSVDRPYVNHINGTKSVLPNRCPAVQ